MKTLLPVIFFTLLCSSVGARQIYSVSNGLWGDSATWSNYMIPDSVNDTIVINHHVYTNGNIILSTNDMLIVHYGDTLCGNDSLFMWSSGQVFVYGCLSFLYYETIDLDHGYEPAFYEIGYGANVFMGGFDLYAGTLEDSLGCLIVLSLADYCHVICETDTNVSIMTTDSTVTISFDLETVSGIYFGDGSYLDIGFQTSVTHYYPDSGYYQIGIIKVTCCSYDTEYYTIHISYQAPPPCIEGQGCTVYANPADGSVTIFQKFCTDRAVTVSVYTDIGQLAFKETAQTTDSQISLSVPTYQFTDGCYFIDMKSPGTQCRKKIVVVHK